MMKALWVMMIVTTVVILFVFFYAFIIMTSQQAVRIADDVEMVVPSSQEPVKSESVNQVPDNQGEDLEDPVIYSFNRDDGAALRQLSLRYKGMDDLDVMDRDLANGNYIPILNRLWTENKSERRFNWLEEKRPERHPLLLFELAVETIKQDPSLKGFTRSLFLLEFARDRTEQDTVCVTDSSADEAASSLYQVYGKAIAEVVKAEPGLYDEIQEAPKGLLTKQVLTPLLQALKDTQTNLDTLPSPKWVSHHALSKLFSNRQVLTDEKKCNQKREELIAAQIKKVESQLSEISRQSAEAATK